MADGPDIRRADLVGPGHVVLQVNLVREVHLRRAHLEHQPLLPPVRRRALDLAVQAARSEERGVQGIGAVRRHDHLHVHRLVETVHLVEELHEDTLHLAVGARVRVEAGGGDGVNLVDEDDGGRVFLGEPEHVPHHPRALAQVLLHKLGSHDADERGGGVMRHSLGEHRLTGTRGTVQEHAAGRVDANLSVQVKVRQGQLDSLANLLLLHVHSSHVAVLHVRSLGIGQQGDGRVSLWGQDIDQRVGVAVERDG